jgi:hypothetical protein
MTTKLMRCTCKHAYQDELYGVGNRMANEMRSGQYVCTVCGATLGSAQSITQAQKTIVKEAVKEATKEVPKKESKKETPKKEAPKGKIDKKSSDKKGSMKGGKR